MLLTESMSVDFLELGGFRQIDFVQQKVSRRRKKKKKKGGKDLGRLGIQRIKLMQLSSDHTCKVYNQPPVLEIVLVITPVNNTAGANLLLLAAAARVPGTWTPPPNQSMPSTHHIYTLSLSFCQGKTTTPYSVCGPRV
ncbi:unnamed protein product [Sphagnum compactum]